MKLTEIKSIMDTVKKTKTYRNEWKAKIYTRKIQPKVAEYLILELKEIKRQNLPFR